MYLITKRTIIRGIAKKWKKQFPNDNIRIYKQLCKLNVETATEKNVIDIIGNTSWTTLKCDECKKEVKAVISLGKQCDYGISTASLCCRCISKASVMINSP